MFTDRLSSPIPSPALQRAFHATRYRIHSASGDFDLRIGQFSTPLQALLATHQCNTAAWLSPCNPRSRILSALENQARLQEFRAALTRHGANYLPSTALPDAVNWPPEQALLVLGLSAAQTQYWAQHYAQDAYLLITSEARPRLILTQQASNRAGRIC